MPGKPDLNPVGLYHLKSHVIQTVGIMSGINTWMDIPDRFEPKEIMDQKKAAWMMARGEAQSVSTLSILPDSDTDVEDKNKDWVPLQVEQVKDSCVLKSSKTCIPVFGCPDVRKVVRKTLTK